LYFVKIIIGILRFFELDLKMFTIGDTVDFLGNICRKKEYDKERLIDTIENVNINRKKLSEQLYR